MEVVVDDVWGEQEGRTRQSRRWRGGEPLTPKVWCSCNIWAWCHTAEPVPSNVTCIPLNTVLLLCHRLQHHDHTVHSPHYTSALVISCFRNTAKGHNLKYTVTPFNGKWWQLTKNTEDGWMSRRVLFVIFSSIQNVLQFYKYKLKLCMTFSYEWRSVTFKPLTGR